MSNDAWQVRSICSRKDIAALARLRYEIWLKEQYVDPVTLPNQCRIELDFADFYSRHFGLFDANGLLVGGGRLIHEDTVGGDELIHILNDIKRDASDPVLATRLAPRYFSLPSDLYGAFPEFIKEYKDMLEHNVKFAEVSRVVIAEKLRGHRLSDLLLSKMISYSKKQGINVLLLTCATHMEAFYSRFGFERHQKVPPDIYGDIKIQSIVMSLNFPT